MLSHDSQNTDLAIGKPIGKIKSKKDWLRYVARTKEATRVLKLKDKIDVFYFLNTNHITDFRYRTLLTKEPSTIAWLDTFTEQDVFWDIGANVGLYTIYAAIKSKCRTLAFEPQAINFSTLVINIALNELNHLITPYAIALSNKTKLDRLFCRSLDAGAAINQLNTNIDDTGDEFTVNFYQGAATFSLDDVLNNISTHEHPTVVKIDIDGQELNLINGGEKFFKKNTLRALQIELDTEGADFNVILTKIKDYGFSFEEANSAGIVKKNRIQYFRFTRK